MRTLLLSSLFLAVIAPGFSQTAADPWPSLPKDPRAVLSAAVPLYDLSSAELKPWHLKATYKFYDANGKPAEQGTWEYWWASPKVRRSSWTRTGAEKTLWSTADGAVYQKETGEPLRYFERTIDDVLLSPLSKAELLDSNKMQLGLKMVPPNKPQLACVSATPQSLGDRKLQAANPDATQEYCFDPRTMALLVVYSDHLMKQYSQLVKTQGRYVARQAVVKYGDQILFSVSVDTIDGLNPSDVEFAPPADAILERSAAVTPQGVATGSLVKKKMPDYPMIAKENHEQGVVILGALIGTDGRIHDLEVLASPSSVLTESAIEAVKTWEYKPYLLNGKPVEVETVVNVYYTLGG
jgi:TonB family protein